MDDKKVTSLEEHKAKLQKRELDVEKETEVVSNPSVPKEMMEDLDACINHDDMEAFLRVLSVLRTIGDKATIEVDQSDIWITTHHESDDNIDAGVDFPEQVVKKSSTYQTSTINFAYKEEEWDSLENFVYNVGFALRRCIESLTYWAAGEKKDD